MCDPDQHKAEAVEQVFRLVRAKVIQGVRVA